MICVSIKMDKEAFQCNIMFCNKSFFLFITDIYLIRVSSDFVRWNEIIRHINDALAACLQSTSPNLHSIPVCFLNFYFSPLFCQLPSFLEGGRVFWEAFSQVYESHSERSLSWGRDGLIRFVSTSSRGLTTGQSSYLHPSALHRGEK